MEAKRQRDALEHLGLSSPQTEVYLALLKRGPLGAAELAAATTIPRTRVYEVAKILEESGLITTTLDVPTRFRALPIREFVEHERERLRAKDAALSERLPDLEAILPLFDQDDGEDEAESVGGFTTLRGPQVVSRKLAAALASAEREVLASVSPELLERLKAPLMAACARGLDLRLLHHVNPKSLHPSLRLVEAGGAVRHAPVPEQLAVFVIDGQVCIIAFPPSSHTGKLPAAGLWTDEPHFVQAQTMAFENGWSRAIQLRDRQRELEEGEAPRTTDLLRARTEDDPKDNARVFLEAIGETLAEAETSLDIALPTIATSALDWKTLYAQLERIRGRLLVPLPKDVPERKIVERLTAIAEVRETPQPLHTQALGIADGTKCLIATQSRQTQHDATPRWESLIVSTETGLVSAVQAHFDANWGAALDLEEASRAGADKSGRWWFASRRSEDALLWAREAISSAVRSVTVRTVPAAADLLPPLLRGVSREVRVETTIEDPTFGAVVVAVDGHLCLVIEDPKVGPRPRGGIRLERVGHVTFTNNPATLRAWSGATIPADDGRDPSHAPSTSSS